MQSYFSNRIDSFALYLWIVLFSFTDDDHDGNYWGYLDGRPFQ